MSNVRRSTLPQARLAALSATVRGPIPLAPKLGSVRLIFGQHSASGDHLQVIGLSASAAPTI
jgi:hypothetical protein